jgi:hypothetical protein
MKLKLPLIATAFCLSYGINAQTGKVALKSNAAQIQNSNVQITKRTCGTDLPSAAWESWFNQKVEEFKASTASGKTQMTNYTIPVIVHVIHGGQAVGTFPNLAQGQINSQITVLNADFAGTGLNNGNLPAVFAATKANTGVSFCLAQKDPNGVTLAEPGIERINYISKGWANPAAAAYNTPTTFQTFVNGTIKPGSIWDPTRYMNIWITDENAATGLLGYATFPAGTALTGLTGGLGTATTDGLWCWAKSFGSNSVFPTGTYDPTYNKGRTATHEIGHWVGLRHIWGDGTCLTDYCTDTPPGQNANYGCPVFPYKVGVCAGNTTGEMTMNFMDYTDDPCMYMFTNDQTLRIQTAMANGTYRSQLSASSATLCTIAAATPTANFTMAGSGCTNSAVTVNNLTNGTPAPTYIWSSNPVTGVTFNPSNTAAVPTINFTTPGTYSITVAATNSLGTNSSTKVISITSCTTAVTCNDTITNVTNTGTLLVGAAGSDTTTPGCSPKAGYIMGSNCYGDKEKAEYFSTSLYSSITSPQIKSVIVLFYKDGTKGTGGNAATAVNMKLYNGTMASGPTGTATPFGQVNATIGNIVAVTPTNSVNYVGLQPIVYTNPIIRPFRYILPSPVNAPATNGFFASITLPTAAGDTAVIMDDGSLVTGTNWEYWSDNTWHNLSVAWGGYDASMAILPEMQCAVTGINKNSVLDANVSLHPNPSNGLVNIVATLPNSQSLEISVHNSLGQLISSTKHVGVTSNVFTMDLSNYSNGVYFVTINNGEERIVKRLILSK